MKELKWRFIVTGVIKMLFRYLENNLVLDFKGFRIRFYGFFREGDNIVIGVKGG